MHKLSRSRAGCAMRCGRSRCERVSPVLVPRMLRSAKSAFTRVFDTLCGALLIRGPSSKQPLVPALRRTAKRRCAASGTRSGLCLDRRPCSDPREPGGEIAVGGIERLADLIAEIDPAIEQDIRQREALAA